MNIWIILFIFTILFSRWIIYHNIRIMFLSCGWIRSEKRRAGRLQMNALNTSIFSFSCALTFILIFIISSGRPSFIILYIIVHTRNLRVGAIEYLINYVRLNWFCSYFFPIRFDSSMGGDHSDERELLSHAISSSTEMGPAQYRKK